MAQNVSIEGIETDGPIPEGWTPYGALVVMKCLDEAGKPRLIYRASDDWSVWEAMGALECWATTLNTDFQDCLESSEDDGDESK